MKTKRKNPYATGLDALEPGEASARDAVHFRKIIAARKKVAEAERERFETQSRRHAMRVIHGQ